MFDILADSYTGTTLMLFDVKLEGNEVLVPQFIFASMGMRPNKLITLKDRNDKPILKVKLPQKLAILPRDLAIVYRRPIEIKEWLRKI